MAQLMVQATSLAQAEAFRYGRRGRGAAEQVLIALETVGHVKKGSVQVMTPQSLRVEDRGVLVVNADPGPGLYVLEYVEWLEKMRTPHEKISESASRMKSMRVCCQSHTKMGNGEGPSPIVSNVPSKSSSKTGV